MARNPNTTKPVPATDDAVVIQLTPGAAAPETDSGPLFGDTGPIADNGRLNERGHFVPN